MRVSRRLYWRSVLVHRCIPFWRWLGGVETGALAEPLAGVHIDRPVYIAGLPRSGSTTLLECLATSELFACHRYADFPMTFTPYWRNRLADLLGLSGGEMRERAHRDGIQVNADSPEAIEEVLWMAGFPGLHTLGTDALMSASMHNPHFEVAYRNHIRKLLLVRQCPRYLAKNNYAVTRLTYLLRLFPEARFVVPIRSPRMHIASLVKQSRLFDETLRDNPCARRYLQWVGHYEFGPDMLPLKVSPGPQWEATLAAWRDGRLVEYWALQWRQVYALVADQLAGNPRLRERTLVVPYEQLCRAPTNTLRDLARHCQTGETDFPVALDDMAGGIRPPDYYRPDFSAPELELIETLCTATARRFGYASALSADPPGNLEHQGGGDCDKEEEGQPSPQ